MPSATLFQDAATKLDATRGKKLAALLTHWDTWGDEVAPFASENIRSEQGSPLDNFITYLAALSEHQSKLKVSASGSKIKFEELGRVFGLSGHEAVPWKGAMYGRAILLTKYARYLAPYLDSIGCVDTQENILKSLQELDGLAESSAPLRLRPYYTALRATPIGRGVVFATFVKPLNPPKHPWGNNVPTADAVRRGVALGEDLPGQDYLLLAYHLPSGVAPRVPTTASPGWAYQRWFRPNAKAKTELHGWTRPIGARVTRQPEVAHAEIDGSTLIFPLRLARA